MPTNILSMTDKSEEIEIKCSFNEMVDVDIIVNNPLNPNKHNDKQINLLAKIIKNTGVRHPVIISNRSKYLVAGHGRLLAFKKLGYKTVPVDYQDFESEADEYAFLVADNKISELAEHDDAFMIETIQNNEDLKEMDFELLGMVDFELPVEPDAAKDEKEDDVPTDVEARVKLGDLWALGDHRLLCGDATSIDAAEKLMRGQKADFGFCDPPYNLGYEYNSYDDNKSDEEYLEFSKLWYSNLKIFTERRAITLGTKNIDIMSMLDKTSGVGCWVKKNWITSCHIAKLQQWEPIYFYGDYTKLKRTSDLFEINRVVQKDVGDSHPCPKQIKLIEDILIHYSKSKVLDLFGGSGSTLIACEKTDRQCYMMELDPHYCSVILKRWEDYTGFKAKLINENKDET